MHIMMTPTSPTKGRHGVSGPRIHASRTYWCFACIEPQEKNFEPGSIRALNSESAKVEI